MDDQMNFEDKNTFPGYIYFRDNGMDYKIGLTNNLVVRGRSYKTANPRDTVVDCFFVETYTEAEAIEAEMKEAARAEGLCAFDNSDEWLQRTDDTEAFWNQFVKQHAKKTQAEWAAFEEVNNHRGNGVCQVVKQSRSGALNQCRMQAFGSTSNMAERFNLWLTKLRERGIKPTLDEQEKFGLTHVTY
jgi:hypothetical protein